MTCQWIACEVTTLDDEPFDYCVRCGCNLCPAHMETGCCGNRPATSGKTHDAGDFDNDPGPDDLASLRDWGDL
jgi:hypothetical protein